MSNTAPLPLHICEFLRHIVRSTWGLELVLLLRRTQDRDWSAMELSREIRGSVSIVNGVLAVFEKTGLVSERESGRFQYSPANAELDKLAAELSTFNAAYPFAVLREVIWAPNENLHLFVDAFRLKKD